jgi:threonine dehydratase
VRTRGCSEPSSLPRPSVAEPTYDDVRGAAEVLAGVAHRTPVLTSRLLDEELGAQVFFKAENLQRMGAFKFRGAYTALSRLTPQQRRRGVVAFSSGNHAQAVALAAQLLEVPATIVMPLDAPAGKVAATRSYGGRIVTYDRYAEDREAIAADLVARHGLALVPPYDHPDVVAGQGTAADELFEEVAGLDLLLCPLGGGGLLAGTLLARDGRTPGCQVFGVEPEAADDGRQSLEQGRIVHIPTPVTIADGAQTQHLGEITFAIIRRSVAGIRTASDAQLVAAMRFFATRMKTVVEPTGCLGLAGLRGLTAGADWLPGDVRGLRVGVLVSGGNVDLDRFAALVDGGPAADS